MLDLWRLKFFNSLYILDISNLLDEWLAKIFSHSVGILLSLVAVSFAGQKLFRLKQSHCSFLLLDIETFEFYLFQSFRPYTKVFDPL
jgi:hypothetical protein